MMGDKISACRTSSVTAHLSNALEVKGILSAWTTVASEVDSVTGGMLLTGKLLSTLLATGRVQNCNIAAEVLVCFFGIFYMLDGFVVLDQGSSIHIT